MCDGVRTDLFPISVRIVRSLVYGVAASMFSTLGIRSLRVSYRLRILSCLLTSRSHSESEESEVATSLLNAFPFGHISIACRVLVNIPGERSVDVL